MAEKEAVENKIVDELADEIVELLGNSKKFSKFLSQMEDSKGNSSLSDERIEKIETKMNELIHKIKLALNELDSKSIQRTESLRQEQNEEILKLNNSVKQLAHSVIKLANEIEILRQKING